MTAIVLVVFALARCTSREADGAPCEGGSDCKSERCEHGYCGGSNCKVDGDCHPGWICGPASSGFLGFGSSGPRCEPRCGACPPTMYCEDGAGAGSTCREGKKPLAVGIEKPAEPPVVGDPVTLTATVRETTGPVKRVTWAFNQSEGVETTPLLTLTRAFEKSIHLTVAVVDESGRVGHASMNLDTACRREGRECRPELCCGGAVRVLCLPGPASGALVCRVPVVPVVTITGPTSATKGQPVTFEARINGDAPLSYVDWYFGMTYKRGDRGQASMTFAFPYAGDVSIVADAFDELGMGGKATASIRVE